MSHLDWMQWQALACQRASTTYRASRYFLLLNCSFADSPVPLPWWWHYHYDDDSDGSDDGDVSIHAQPNYSIQKRTMKSPQRMNHSQAQSDDANKQSNCAKFLHRLDVWGTEKPHEQLQQISKATCAAQAIAIALVYPNPQPLYWNSPANCSTERNSTVAPRETPTPTVLEDDEGYGEPGCRLHNVLITHDVILTSHSLRNLWWSTL